MDDKINKLIASVRALNERVTMLEIAQDLDLIDHDISNDDEFQINWTDVSMEKIDKLMADIFASTPMPKLPLEYNKLQDNVIEFPVKFNRQ